jgi:catechol 2,3-dioxygenase-like lactoylglutathione lyase family enzyme
MSEPLRFHLSLNVRDLERSIAFYRDTLGLDPDKVHPGYARFLLDRPALVLSLNEVGEVRGGNRLSHAGMRLDSPEALAAARTRLVERGHAVRDEHQTLCCHAVQDKFWVDDPDGNEWEFYLVTDDHPEARSKSSEPPRKSCC